MITKEDIQVMKETWLAFGGWPTERQEWAKENWKEFRLVSGEKKVISEFSSYIAYRLRPDYQLPEEKKTRWFVDVRSENNGVLYTCHSKEDIEYFEDLVASKCLIEFQENELPYLERPKAVEGFDWVFKIPELGEQVLSALVNNKKIFSQGHAFNKDTNGCLLGKLHGYRWVKVPKKKSGFVDYEVKRGINGYFAASEEGQFFEYLNEAINSPEKLGLFAGVRFEGQDDNTWYLNPVALKLPSGEIAPCWCLDEDNKCKPATPVRARFWVGGES